MNYALYGMFLYIVITLTGCDPDYLHYTGQFFENTGSSLLLSIPALVAWIAGVVIGIRMIRQGGGKSGKLFVTGCSLMFINKLMGPFLIVFTDWLISEFGYDSMLMSVLVQAVPYALLSLSGIVCLVYAFWLLFRKEAKQEQRVWN
jgi:hypothetical protein